MKKFEGKKLLLLGGKPIGSCEIVEYAKANGAYVIVADYLPKEQSPAKKNADEDWNLSTGDVDTLAQLVNENNIDGVIAGVHEFNIERALDLTERLHLPYYCNQKQWQTIDNKYTFKELCKAFGIPTAKTYQVDDTIDYPVIVKPTDGSGSRGFSICANKATLDEAIQKALEVSFEKKYLIEEFVDSDACIVHYTAIDGEIIYSGMSDKVSMSFVGGSRVMALQTFPSKSEAIYLETLNEKAIAMFKSLGIKNGPIWIELFNDLKNHRMLFNEAGFRFGGSMTNHVVQYYHGINQLDNIVSCSLNAPMQSITTTHFEHKKYCILPIHIKPGIIQKVEGQSRIMQMPNVNAFAFVHFEGDEILDWGTAQQVFCYLHVLYETPQDLRVTVEDVLKTFVVQDTKGNDMLFTLFDTARLEEI